MNPLLSPRERIRGGLWGSLGDALGVPVEFKNCPAMQADPVADMRGHGTISRRADDGALILCGRSARDRGGRCVGAARGRPIAAAFQRCLAWKLRLCRQLAEALAARKSVRELADAPGLQRGMLIGRIDARISPARAALCKEVRRRGGLTEDVPGAPSFG